MPESEYPSDKLDSQLVLVHLDQLHLYPLCHEDLDELSSDTLDDLFEFLLLHGVPEVVEFYVDDQGRSVVIRGHRLVLACRLLATQRVDGFSTDMKIQATQIRNAGPRELLLRSADDSVVRFHLDYAGRMRVALALDEAGIPADRAAAALALPVETYVALVARAQELDS